jgi:hypothetical protein
MSVLSRRRRLNTPQAAREPAAQEGATPTNWPSCQVRACHRLTGLAGHRSKEHAPIGDIVADVPGWLQPEDELKLYELAHAAAGPILEIGTYRGRSTTIMALAAEAGAGAFIVSVDVDPQAETAARVALDPP